MRCLVSGSSGIVGRYLIRELINTAGIKQIVAISRKNRYVYDEYPNKDVCKLLNCYGDLRYNPTRLISQFKPSVIFHCAGEGRQNAPAKDIWQANVDTTFNLLEACKCLEGDVKFIYCSSIVVNDWPITPYAASKIAGETLVSSYNSRREVIGMNVRFPAVAGAGNKHGVVKAVVEKLLDKSTDKLSLLTNSRKPFVYSGELAKNIVDEAITGECGLVEMCPKDTISVEEIANIVMEQTGIRKEIVWSNESWSGDQQEVKPSMSDWVMLSSELAVSSAIDDILREDYGFTE